MKMASNRISAAMKDDIKKYFNKKLSKIDENIEKIGNELAQVKIDSVHNSPEFKEFKEELNKFYNWLSSEVDEEILDTYPLDRMVSIINSNSLARLPYRSKLAEMFSEDDRIKSLEEEKHAISKECNQLIWNIEMSPKSSKEYKEAIAKAEAILFKD